MRAGKWEKEEYAKAIGLKGRRIGIVGLGHVGRTVAQLARAYEMELFGWSRSLHAQHAAELGLQRAASVEELAAQSDILTLHVELTDYTRGIVSRRVLEALPDGAMVINTARAELMDYDALLELIPKKRLRVGLDVLPSEPPSRSAVYDHPIVRSGLVYTTPHIGASTDQAQTAIAAETVRILRSFIVKGEVPNVVNVTHASRARYQLVVRHLDRVGALANVLAVLKRHGINIQELENTVFEGGKAGCARIRTDTRPSEGCMTEIMAFSDEVLHVDIVALPNLA
jgi:D-3-phosphoglycerate dehydrogenase